MMKDETSLRIRDWAALKQGDVLGFGGSKFLDQVMEILRDFSILPSHKTEDINEPPQALL